VRTAAVIRSECDRNMRVIPQIGTEGLTAGPDPKKKGMNKMGYRGRRSFDRARGSQGRQGFDRDSRGRQGIDRGPREMHKSVCAECGKECEVPFRPTGDRPVYCQECWATRRPSRTENRGQREYSQQDRQRSPSPAAENVDLQILAELKRIREALEKQQPN
jgi:CxxC-x17-CxxC domain-containing protein